jgi:hypothetical protein
LTSRVVASRDDERCTDDGAATFRRDAFLSVELERVGEQEAVLERGLAQTVSARSNMSSSTRTVWAATSAGARMAVEMSDRGSIGARIMRGTVDGVGERREQDRTEQMGH